MATKKRLIDANELVDAICRSDELLHSTQWETDEIVDQIDRIPTVDAVEVVRCKDCRYSRLPAVLTQKYGLPGTMTCANQNSPCNHRNTLGDFFCSYGERKDND